MPQDDEQKPESERLLEKRPDAPPTSRLGRLARLGALSTRAIPMATEAMRRGVFGKRKDEEAEREAQKRVLINAKKTAEAMLKTLGEMKGLPLKLGQMASYIDGLAPPGYEEKFQEVLKKLQAKAPPLSREAAIKVITKELGPPEEIFAEFELDPFAAASIGQVHRAVTKTGAKVAVKVQYPDIDKAIINDLKSVSLLESMIAPVGRKYHSKETLDEIKSVFLAELDYGLEAENAALFTKMHADDPEIKIPRIWNAYSTRRVLTAEMIGGVDYATFCKEASQEDKNAASKTIWRFMFRSLYKYGFLYADPHPGNYRFLGGGNVAFLDYGCIKRLTPEMVHGTRRYLIAAMDEDWDEFERACIEVLGYDPNDKEAYQLFIDYSKMILIPLSVDADFKHTHEVAREAIAYLVRGGKKLMKPKDGDVLPNLPKPIHMPQDHTFMNRLQWGLASVMAGLGGEGNFRRIAEPWIRGPYVPNLVEARAFGARSDNLLVHGDNLLVLQALRARFAGKISAAYLDPPFNTGRSFVEYNDALSPKEWAGAMRARIEALHPLIADDGAVFVEIDDTSIAALSGILDRAFGAANRISTITVVRSASTGHKAQNRGPVHVSDFVLAYAKNKKKWKYRPQQRVRAGFDHAYATWLDNPEAKPAKWTFRPLRAAIAELLGHPTTSAARKALGTEVFRARVESIALRRARHVVRFAQPRYEAIAQAAQAIVDRSRAAPARVFVHEREGRPPFIVRAGNRILFLADKVRVVEGEPRIVEPLTNVWDDVPFQGIAREGGVVFSRNKKPERLVARVLAMSSDPGDWVLDPFLGSGTTAAVAHKMGRRWIGIENGEHLLTLAEPRLRRVVEGTDPTGVTSVYSFAGGGGFRVATLA